MLCHKLPKFPLLVSKLLGINAKAIAYIDDVGFCFGKPLWFVLRSLH